VDEYEELLTTNRIWKQRTVGIGVVAPEQAQQWGMSGPMLRGSGIEWDLRKKQPYAKYAEVDFDIPVGVNGDCYDRYLVRVEEMRQSNRIIKQCVQWLRANRRPGDRAKLQGRPAAARAHEGGHGRAHPPLQAVHRRLLACRPAKPTAAVEAPKGEFGCYLVSDGANKPFRVHLRAPGFAHLSSIDTIVSGHMLADVVAMIGTYDLVFGEVDR
jgi:NADH-quinone oxidoreductase subunit D